MGSSYLKILLGTGVKHQLQSSHRLTPSHGDDPYREETNFFPQPGGYTESNIPEETEETKRIAWE